MDFVVAHAGYSAAVIGRAQRAHNHCLEHGTVAGGGAGAVVAGGAAGVQRRSAGIHRSVGAITGAEYFFASGGSGVFIPSGGPGYWSVNYSVRPLLPVGAG